jgi:hypothetical protein
MVFGEQQLDWLQCETVIFDGLIVPLEEQMQGHLHFLSWYFELWKTDFLWQQLPTLVYIFPQLQPSAQAAAP